MPGLSLTLAQTATLFHATHYREFDQSTFLTAYQAITGDERYKNGVCAAMVKMVADKCDGMLHPTYGVDELNKWTTLMRCVQSARREASSKEQATIQEAGLLYGSHAMWGPSFLDWSRAPDDLEVGYEVYHSSGATVTLIAKQLIAYAKKNFQQTVNLNLAIGYDLRVNEVGEFEHHGLLFASYLFENKLYYLYFDPNDGLLVWDNQAHFFTFLVARLEAIYEKSQQCRRLQSAIEGHSITKGESKPRLYYSLMGRGPKWSKDKVKLLAYALEQGDEQLLAYANNLSLAACHQLFLAEKTTALKIMTELTTLKQKLFSLLFNAPYQLSKVVENFISSKSSNDDIDFFHCLTTGMNSEHLLKLMYLFHLAAKIPLLVQMEGVASELESIEAVSIPRGAVGDRLVDCLQLYSCSKHIKISRQEEKSAASATFFKARSDNRQVVVMGELAHLPIYTYV